MSIVFKPASREKIGLLISCIGSTGSGKTLSALLLARGLCDGDDSKIAVIDTEAGRALHYAPAAGQKPGPFTFGFHHADMMPPFSPEAYMEAIDAADKAKYGAIVIDSFSHEYAGEGGLDDMHEDELERMMNGDESKREKLSIGAWKKPKQRHKRLISRMLQCRAHLIVCLRAEEKLRISKVQDGPYKKTVVTAAEDLPLVERWVPITEKRFPYELTCSLLFTAAAPGVPIPVKLEKQHRDFIALDRQIGSDTGMLLADWARGGAPKPATGAPSTTSTPAAYPPAWDTWSLQERGENRANAGIAAFREWWKTLTKDEQASAQKFIEGWKETASKVQPN